MREVPVRWQFDLRRHHFLNEDIRLRLFYNYQVRHMVYILSLIHISEPTRQAEISYAVFCLKKKKKKINQYLA